MLRFHSRCANEGKPDVISNQFSEPTYIDMHTNFQASAARMRSLERCLLTAASLPTKDDSRAPEPVLRDKLWIFALDRSDCRSCKLAPQTLSRLVLSSCLMKTSSSVRTSPPLRRQQCIRFLLRSGQPLMLCSPNVVKTFLCTSAPYIHLLDTRSAVTIDGRMHKGPGCRPLLQSSTV